MAASSLARWWLKAGRSRCSATMSSLCRFSSGRRFWARIRLSMEGLLKGIPYFSHPAAIKPISKSALWAARGRPPANSKKGPQGLRVRLSMDFTLLSPKPVRRQMSSTE